jgi:hypothetical protein
MRDTKIITAKIDPGIYGLIEKGTKTLEVRDATFGDADIIHYVSSQTGNHLGFWQLGRKSRALKGLSPAMISNLAAVSIDIVGELGLDKADALYVAEVGPVEIRDMGAYLADVARRAK